jgi:hypothetical protein
MGERGRNFCLFRFQIFSSLCCLSLPPFPSIMASEVERGERRERETLAAYEILFASLFPTSTPVDKLRDEREKEREREGDKREKIRIWNWRGDQKATGMPSSCQ